MTSLVVLDDPRHKPFKFTAKQEAARQVLNSDATHVALGGGSRSGKTLLILSNVITRALKENESRHAIFRFRFNAVVSSVVLETLPDVMAMRWPGLRERCKLHQKPDYYLELPNGSEIWFCGLEDKDRVEKVLGKEYSTVHFNECSQIPYLSVVTALSRLAQKTESLRLKAYYDFNPPSKVHWTYKQFIEKRDPVTNQPAKNEFNYGFYLINPADNRDNIAPEYFEILEAMPPRQRNRFLLGQFADVDEGALWTEELLEVTRRIGREGESSIPQFLRVVIAVDPSGTRGPEDTRSDEVGIVVVALGTDGHGYLLEDMSGRFKPEDWSEIVEAAFHRHRADVVVGESNFGGDMVRAVIQAKNKSITYKEVHASRGKVVRAEPISTLYSTGKIHHVGYFPELEEQLCSFTTSGPQGLKSPDRADAAVWGFTELFPGLTRKVEDVSPASLTVKTMVRSSAKHDPSRHRRIR